MVLVRINSSFPNGSECIFRNYSQDITVLEGGDLRSDLVRRASAAPHGIETLRFRLVTRAGASLDLLSPRSKATLRRSKSSSMGRGRSKKSMQNCSVATLMPRVQHCVRRSACVIYFWTSDNPFGNYQQIRKNAGRGAPHRDQKRRAYGVPTKGDRQSLSQIPREGPCVRPPTGFPAAGTRYVFCDPASSRNWFPHLGLGSIRKVGIGSTASGRAKANTSPGVGRPWSMGGARTGVRQTVNQGLRRLPLGGGSGVISTRSADWKRSSQGTIRKKRLSEEILERWMDSRFW